MTSEKTSSHAAKHAFFYLTSFFALGLCAIAVGTLFFQIINVFFPQEGMYYSSQVSQGAVTFGISALVITAPVFFFITRIINHSLSKKDLNVDSGIRRWLTYIVMFITAATVIGDLIATLNSFLLGEITVRFLLKALVILLIAGGIFLYYLTDMRNESEESRKKKNTVWSVVFWTIIVVPFVWAFFVMESPQTARQRNIDQETSSYLESVRSAIENYAAIKQELPRTIQQAQELQPQGIYGLGVLQQRKFSYKPLSDTEYELCAEFQRDNRSDNTDSDFYGEWLHPQGLYCFPLSVSKQQIVPFDKSGL